MIYGKLPVVFLSTIASEKKDSTNSIIASYILNHLDEMKNMGIKEIADQCHVAVSSVSRFCKEIGLRDFAELRELLITTDLYFEKQSSADSLLQRMNDYRTQINESMAMVQNSLDERQLFKICEDIKKYHQVALFGLLKAGSVALNLQGDLLMLGKQVYTNISYASQMHYILNASEQDLIIIFSYTGSYFDYQDLRSLKKKLKVPKIWMICAQQASYPDFVDEVLSFASLQNQTGHPYQLQFVASLISQEYARKYCL